MRHNALTLTIERKRRASPERSFQASVAEFLNLALPVDSYWNVIPAGDGKVVTAPGYTAGAPDLFIVYRSRIMFIELKDDGADVSEEQREAHKRIAWAGADMMVAWKLDAIERWLLSKGVPLKATVAA